MVPCVSIGLPVYNGEAYLGSALGSLLAQAYGDFEVIISDNASTDGTATLARAAAARDPRVRYFRAPENRGAIVNFNDAFRRARGRYFKWAAADDLVDAQFIGRAVAELERDPSIVLCHSNTRIIGGDGTPVGDFAYAPGYVGSAWPSLRLADMLRQDRWCFELFGVIRSAALRSTALMRPFVGADRALLAELALRGRFAILSDYLFLNRDHAERAVRRFPAHHLRAAHDVPALAGRRLLPHWRILGEYVRAVQRAPLAASERARCHLELLRWVGRHGNWARLASDPLVALVPASGEILARLAGSERGWLKGRIGH